MVDEMGSKEEASPSTLTELLRRRARKQPLRTGFVFPKEAKGQRDGCLTYGDLDRLAGTVGQALQSAAVPGDRILLLFPAGPEFLAAFFGCLYAGVIPVPAPLPRRHRPAPGLSAIAADCAARFVLTTKVARPVVKHYSDHFPDFKILPQLVIDLDDCGGISTQWPEGDPEINRQPRTGLPTPDLALLQYTSGSTGAPRGVMVTHANVLSNAAALQQFSGLTPADQQVCWLPHYHDMGLFGGIVLPLYGGFPSVLLPPAAFLRRPVRWLEEISERQATATAGPNFAYDLCIRNTTPEQRAALDLSSLRLAVVGAEPVRADTLDLFNETFGPHGFHPEMFRPCYGLAEATLLVAAGDPRNGPIVEAVHTAGLDHRDFAFTGGPMEKDKDDARSLRIVKSGRIVPGSLALIVDPETRSECPPGRVGEIWLSGPGVASGYWGHPQLTAETFRATLAAAPEGPHFLRTGDLGFLKDGDLFVTGRLKDLIIIRGRNHYPQDLEQTAERSHPVLQPCRSAAFPVDGAGEEKVILAAEIGSHAADVNVHEIASAVRLALAQCHEVELSGLVLLPPRSLPQTSSGKTQRSACRKAYLEGTLDTIAFWTPASVQIEAAAGEGEDSGAKPRTAPAIEAWLVARLVRRMGSPDRVDAHTPFASCGLDSMAAVGLAAELEASLACPVPPTLVYEHPTPRALAAHLSRQLAAPLCAAAAQPGLEQERRARLVAEVERLSENDAADLLAAEVAEPGQVI